MQAVPQRPDTIYFACDLSERERLGGLGFGGGKSYRLKQPQLRLGGGGGALEDAEGESGV